MPPIPEEPQGLGTPSGSRPGFAPPSGAPTPFPPAPTPWSAPDPALLIPLPPSGRPHRTRARSRIRWVAALVAAALVLVGILSALPLLSTSSPQPQLAPSATPAPITTVTPSTQPGTASTARAGGDLGTTMAFRSGDAGGSITVTSAVWTDTGEMAPESGHRYLVLDVTVRCSKGSLPVDALMFVAQDSEGPVLPSFGPVLTDPLGGRVLGAGESVRGQLGYSVLAGAATLQLLDPSLEPVLTVRIPAP